MVCLLLPYLCFVLCTRTLAKNNDPFSGNPAWQRQQLSPATFSGMCRICCGKHIDSAAYTMFTILWPAERCRGRRSTLAKLMTMTMLVAATILQHGMASASHSASQLKTQENPVWLLNTLTYVFEYKQISKWILRRIEPTQSSSVSLFR